MIGRTNTGGGGGGGLNFKVIGGTTAPSNPKENTIWINTSTAITDWVFSATQPTAASGRVWISTGTSSSIEFNALKKNGIQVYPLSVKQYVSNKWVDKTAKSYQNGSWVDWVFYLFSAEKGINKGSWNKAVESNGSFSVSDSAITISNSSNGSAWASVINTEPIDTTGKTWLIVRMTTTGSVHSNTGFGLTSNPDNLKSTSVDVYGSLSTGDIKVNIANLSGVYYFKIWIFKADSGSTPTCTITEIRTE
jgi:hypothetical protein